MSVGIVEGTPMLDLDYEKDVRGRGVNMNVVMSGRGLLVEVQGTAAERAPFTRGELDQLLDLAASGISELHDLQRRAVAAE